MRRAVVAYLLRNGLMLSRPRMDTGEHAAPGGRIEDGETEEAALSREVLEEIGLVVTAAWSVYFGSHGAWIVRVYRIEADGEPIAAEAGSRVEWVPVEAIATGFAAEFHTQALRAAGLLG